MRNAFHQLFIVKLSKIEYFQYLKFELVIEAQVAISARQLFLFLFGFFHRSHSFSSFWTLCFAIQSGIVIFFVTSGSRSLIGGSRGYSQIISYGWIFNF